jgi:hypothetical protein
MSAAETRTGRKNAFTAEDADTLRAQHVGVPF